MSETPRVALDAATKFFNCIRLSGWCFSSKERLIDCRLVHPKIKYSHIEKNLPYGGVPSLGEDLGFEMTVVMEDGEWPTGAQVFFQFSSFNHVVDLDLLRNHMLRRNKSLFADFRSMMDGDSKKIIDIGGRSRSGVDRSKSLGTHEVTVFDVLEGENVNVVGDAHKISSYFDEEIFDAFYSVSVFEHLAMPWKVAVELNKILKPNAIGFVFTHQTIGIHDAPWDFWRYSRYTWNCIFNEKSGFEIIESSMDLPHFIVPKAYHPSSDANYEQAVGYKGSSVLVKKIGPTSLEWPVDIEDCTKALYPK